MKARSCFWQRSMASAVEMVEALTIVVAVGVTRGWRAALAGVGAATVTLAVVVAVLGQHCIYELRLPLPSGSVGQGWAV